MEDNKEKESIKARIFYNNNKLVADKIRKTLLNIRNIPNISEKRWIWELIQNAKDVPNLFGKVKIKIELNKNSLIFSHNGSFFTIDNVLGILQQVSSKDSINSTQTGKFGTGFIGTHLLSDEVAISGIVKYNDTYRKFKLNLDRSGNSSEEMLKEVSKSINEFEENMEMENNANSKYEEIPLYKQKITDFDTKFEYNLKNEKSVKIAQAGLDDLKNTAPATLSTQHKKIDSIHIINNIKNEEIIYSINVSPKDKDKQIYLNTISIRTNGKVKKEYFYSIESQKCRLLYQVQKTEFGYSVLERKKGQPVLFRDFPLIGSENFHFPFLLDGFKFIPLKTRNGLYLNGKLNIEAEQNREIIDNAITTSLIFTDWLLKQSIDKRYLLAKTNIPEPPQKYDDSAIQWFIDSQKNWRKKLKEKDLLLDDEDSFHCLKMIKLPEFKEKYNEDFYEIIKKMNITDGILPNENNIKEWYDIMKKDPLKDVYELHEDTWEFNYLFTEQDLYKKIEEFRTVSDFREAKDATIEDIYSWLNELYKFMSKYKCIDALYKHKMIPNQKGVFRLIGEIYGNDSANKIPVIIEPIYKKFLM